MPGVMESQSALLEVVLNSSAKRDGADFAATANLGVLNARSVELIAQSRKIRELRNCKRGELMEHLKKQRGFAGAILLNSLKEPRLILAMSFWQAEKEASKRWETSATVVKLISPLIDVCTRVQIYEATLPGVSHTEMPIERVPFVS